MTDTTHSPEKSDRVLIVGAGLAGLACALALQARSIPFEILEASDGPGGRVRTDFLDGYLLDRGFQVYLTAYPEGQRVLDYQALDFHRFAAGALVRYSGKFHRAMDPWREPFAALSSILSPVGSMADKLLVARLRASAMAGTPEQLLLRPEKSSMQALLDFGFSQNIITRFFQPFFGAIMYDTQLRVSSRMLEYVFRMMASGDTVLPGKGMGAIPAQLAARLPAGAIRYGARVAAVGENSVTLDDGQLLGARAVVVATEGPEAVRLLPRLPPVQGRKAMTAYFGIEGASPVADPMVVLNGNGQWPIQSCCVPSVVCPNYAPAGHHLMSVTLLGESQQEEAQLVGLLRGQLGRWFGDGVKGWKFLRLYRLPHAHPVNAPPTLQERPVMLENGVFICGDHRFFPSIQAALENGRHAGEAVANHVH